MKWLEARSTILPRIVPGTAAGGVRVGVPWVNDCCIVPVVGPSNSVPRAVVPSDVFAWADEAAAIHQAGWQAESRAEWDSLRLDGAAYLVSRALFNLQVREASRPSIRGMSCPSAATGRYSFDCAGCDATDGFAASRLMLPGLWATACKVLGNRAQFWAAIPCDDCLAVFRSESEARRLLASPALRGKDNPRPICLEPFVLTRDGVAGLATFADMGDGLGLSQSGGPHAAD